MKRQNRVYLVRHGQIKGYEDFLICGHTDVDITATGVIQMQQMAERLRVADISAIYASDLTRSSTGARYLAAHHDVPVKILPDLREMFFGDWEGMPFKELRARFPDELEERRANLAEFRAPGRGESLVHFSERIMKRFNAIRKEHEGQDIALVVHGGVNRVIICEALGLEIEGMFRIQQDYGCLNIIDYFADTTIVRLLNG